MIQKYKKNIASVFAFLLFCFFSVNMAWGDSFNNPLKYETLVSLLEAILKTIVYIMTPIIVLMIIYTGYLFIAAQGNPGELSKARTSFMWSLIGAVIVLGAVGIMSVVEDTVKDIIK